MARGIVLTGVILQLEETEGQKMVNHESQRHIQKKPSLVKSITSYFTPSTGHIDGPVKEYKPNLTPVDIDVEFEDGEIIRTHIKSARCEMCYKGGFYQIYSRGDVDGPENRCNKCGHKMWGPICFGVK